MVQRRERNGGFNRSRYTDRQADLRGEQAEANVRNALTARDRYGKPFLPCLLKVEPTAKNDKDDGRGIDLWAHLRDETIRDVFGVQILGIQAKSSNRGMERYAYMHGADIIAPRIQDVLYGTMLFNGQRPQIEIQTVFALEAIQIADIGSNPRNPAVIDFLDICVHPGIKIATLRRLEEIERDRPEPLVAMFDPRQGNVFGRSWSPNQSRRH